MITIYRRYDNQIHCQQLAAGEAIPRDVVWIDILTPTHDEELDVEKQLSIQIPSREEVWKNQALNRLYQEDDVAYMTAAIITKVESPYPQTSAVTFILTQRYLLTMRYILPTSFQMFAQRFQRYPQKFVSGPTVLEGLLEEVITRVAHNSEVVSEALDKLSHDIFDPDAFEKSRKTPSQLLINILRRLGASADLNSKINESLHSLGRLLTFFKQVPGNSESVSHSIDTLIADVFALNKQTAFLTNKITFQQDATLGMINVAQNMIVKVFSIAAVLFMPPTLVASVYGMNFADIPELHWAHGYPMALVFMAFCALAPYLFFRKKGWL